MPNRPTAEVLSLRRVDLGEQQTRPQATAASVYCVDIRVALESEYATPMACRSSFDIRFDTPRLILDTTLKFVCGVHVLVDTSVPNSTDAGT